MRYCLIAFALLTLCANAAVYKRVDKQGNVYYSDKPVTGAEKIKLPPPGTYSSPQISPVPAPPTRTQRRLQSKQIATRFIIAAPRDQQTLRSAQGNIKIAINIQPALRKTNKIRLLLDGKSQGDFNSTTITLKEVDRGAHKIEALLIDSKNRVIANSNTVTVFFHRPRVNQIQKSKHLPAVH